MSRQLPARSRVVAIVTAVVFIVSAAFPVVAGLAKDTAAFPSWWGLVDVLLAFCLALLAMWVSALAQGRIDARIETAVYRAYRVMIHAILALLVIFFLVGDRIVWINCLTGFGWRACAAPLYVAGVADGVREARRDGAVIHLRLAVARSVR